MRFISIFLFNLLLLSQLQAQPSKKLKGNKAAAVSFVEASKDKLIQWNNQVWEYAEPSEKEFRSSQLFVDIFKKEGFTVQENVSGFPTMFIATYGTEKPVIGLFGEYDADPNASNKLVPRKEELVTGGYGHGGSHNVLGVGSLGAALAIKDLIRRGRLQCTIRYYGTTAEGSTGAKAYLARDGFFKDLDLSLYWHPAPITLAPASPWDALIDFDIVLSAKRLNIIRQQSNDSTTLDALERLLPELKKARNEMSAGIRFNYAVRQWKTDLAYIPDTLRLNVRIQCTRQEQMVRLFDQVKNAVANVSLQTGVKSAINVTRAMHQFLPNLTAMRVVQQNMEWLGPISYSEQEQAYAKEMQSALGLSRDGITDKILSFTDQSNRSEIYGYASDIGDASWIAPEIYFIVRALPGVPMHQWPGTAFSGHSIGHKGMLQAAKLLAMTIVDYLEDKSLQNSIREEFIEKTKHYQYRSFLQPIRF
jgi:aminobenzoyl-glutamate utilization protein B